jgi:hypothetical protein
MRAQVMFSDAAFISPRRNVLTNVMASSVCFAVALMVYKCVPPTHLPDACSYRLGHGHLSMHDDFNDNDAAQ